MRSRTFDEVFGGAVEMGAAIEVTVGTITERGVYNGTIRARENGRGRERLRGISVISGGGNIVTTFRADDIARIRA